MSRASSSSTSWPAIGAAVALHVGLAALFLFSGPRAIEDIKPMVSSVPVSIVSDMVIEAAAPDNPSETPSTEDGATAPPPEAEPAPPVPQPTPPQPTPAPRPAEKAPALRPTPPRPAPTPPTKARPTPRPPTPTPARPAPRVEPSLNLDELAGPPRPSRNPGRPAPGQQGAGAAPQATGPQVTAIFNQVYPNWILPCDIPGADQLRIQVELTLSETGRITAGPTLVSPRSDPVYRAAADGALRALRQTAPFDVPQGFPGGRYRPTFNTERACRNR